MDSINTSPRSEYYSINGEDLPEYDAVSDINDSMDETNQTDAIVAMGGASTSGIDRSDTTRANARGARHTEHLDSTDSANTTTQTGQPHASQTNGAHGYGFTDRKGSQLTEKRGSMDDYTVVDHPTLDNSATSQTKSPEPLLSAEFGNDQVPTSATTASGSSRANSTLNGVSKGLNNTTDF
jgi:hypothetical protein